MCVFRITSRGVKLDSALTERDCKSNSKKQGEGGGGGRLEHTSHVLIWTNNVLQDWITGNTGETPAYIKHNHPFVDLN